MDTNCNQLTERVLQLTLEIIYLLTGEDNIFVKKTLTDEQNYIMIPLRSLLIPERGINKKILEATNKISKLLMGEVPIRCQDVTVYFSMEEWEYLEGHKDLYKDVIMEDQLPLTSSDESSNCNPPERCPRPLYSQDSTQDHTIPHHDQIEDVIDQKIVGTEEVNVSTDQQSMEEAQLKIIIKEEMYIDTSGRYEDWNTSEGHHCYTDETITAQCSSDFRSVTERSHKAHVPFLSSECRKDSLTTHQQTSTNEKQFSCQNCSKPFCLDPKEKNDSLLCLECDNVFKKGSKLQKNERGQSEKSFTCPYCNESFNRKCDQEEHLNTHTNPPFFDQPIYPCPDCNKWFKSPLKLAQHQRSHALQKTFPCSECGKLFKSNSELRIHSRVHTGEKPFSCSDCGRNFSNRGNRDKHMRVHTGEKPFCCLECGRCFAQKATLIFHQNTHNKR